MSAEPTCGLRWYGPRADVPEAYANHVCEHAAGHEGQVHRCVCGAVYEVPRP